MVLYAEQFAGPAMDVAPAADIVSWIIADRAAVLAGLEGGDSRWCRCPTGGRFGRYSAGMEQESNISPNDGVPVAAVQQVDALIDRALHDLEDLVRLRESLTGEDLLGDRRRTQETFDEMRADARARDPQGWARANAWARATMQRMREDRPPVSTAPNAVVCLAVDVVGQCRAVRQEESRRATERIERMVSGDGPPKEGPGSDAGER